MKPGDGAGYLPVMTDVARQAGAILSEYFAHRDSLSVSSKTVSDFVSEADLNAERCIFDRLQVAWPDIGAWLEEGGRVQGEDPELLWIVDPLDGTTNFINGIPHFAVSIALVRSGVPLAGVVYNPVADELFSAASGKGATLNDRQIRCLERSDLSCMLLGTGFPFGDKTGHEQLGSELTAAMKACAGVRRIGSAALDLCYVACGRFDAFWEHQLQPWDIAAGVLLVREAGGIATRFSGDTDPLPFTDILAGSTAAYEKVACLLQGK